MGEAVPVSQKSASPKFSPVRALLADACLIADERAFASGHSSAGCRRMKLAREHRGSLCSGACSAETHQKSAMCDKKSKVEVSLQSHPVTRTTTRGVQRSRWRGTCDSGTPPRPRRPRSAQKGSWAAAEQPAEGVRGGGPRTSEAARKKRMREFGTGTPHCMLIRCNACDSVNGLARKAPFLNVRG